MLSIWIEVCPVRLIVGQLLHRFKIYYIYPYRRKLKYLKKKEAGQSLSDHRFEQGIFHVLVRIDTTQSVSHIDAVGSS